MSETKRKTHTSTQVKRCYNDKIYTAMTFRVPKELAAEFKQICTDNDISQVQVIKDAMQKTIDEYSKKLSETLGTGVRRHNNIITEK